MPRLFFGAALSVALVGSITLWPTPAAAAAPSCDALPDEPGTPITKLYVENGDTQELLVKRLGKLLMTSTNKVRVIYRNRPTCSIRTDLFTGAKMQSVTEGTPPALRVVRYIPVDTSAFNPDDKTTPPPECAAPDVGTQPIALGIGATYLASCDPAGPPAGVVVVEGPVQAYGFVTGIANTATVAITAEEGYLAYGFPEATGDAKPWIVQNLRFKRGKTASTALVMSAAVGLKPDKLLGAPDSTKSEDIIAAIKAETVNPLAAIGTLGMDLYDQNRAILKVLAFKAPGQKFAYFPDKTSTSFDKQNVRDGHYLPWAPTPYISKGTAGVFDDPNAKRFLELVLGTRQGDDVDGLLQVAGSGLIPQCAMKVTRAMPLDGTPVSLYSDPAPCGCYFEKNVPQGSTTCKACTGPTDTTCAPGACRLGFCEAK